MTELRYLPDSDDITEFAATATEATPEYIVLDGTYFYPEGGGQPADHGVLEWDSGRATIRGARKDHSLDFEASSFSFACLTVLVPFEFEFDA